MTTEMREIKAEGRAREIAAGKGPAVGKIVQWRPGGRSFAKWVTYADPCAGRITEVGEKAARLMDGSRITVESAHGEVKVFTYRYIAGWVEAGKRSDMGASVWIPGHDETIDEEIPEGWA